MLRTVLLIAWLVGIAGVATAATALTELTDKVPGQPRLTNFDLAKLVVTDLVATPDGAAGHKVVGFRHIEGKAMQADPGDSITLGTNTIDVMPIAGRPDRLLALIDLGGSEGNVEEAALLGLYALTPKLKLLDLVGVGNDRWTALDNAQHAMLAPGSPLIVVDSGHSNSNETYDSTEAITIRGDRFRLIDSFFTFSESFCAYTSIQAPSFTTLPAAGPYRTLRVSVKQTVKLTGDDCGDDTKPPKAGVTVFTGFYQWDGVKGRFVSHSAQLDALAKMNTARVNAP